jgi:hypothetical protein
VLVLFSFLSLLNLILFYLFFFIIYFCVCAQSKSDPPQVLVVAAASCGWDGNVGCCSPHVRSTGAEESSSGLIL